MKREAWLLFAVLAGVVGLGLFAMTAFRKNEALALAQAEFAKAREELARTQAEVTRQKGVLAEVEGSLRSARSQAEQLAREMSQATNNQQRLEAEMRAALQSRDVAVSELQGRLTVNILDRILFDSGEAQLKPEGTKVLDQVAGVLAGFTNRQIQVFGHTDNRPIRLRFASNWELSMARAVAAVRYLSERAGVDPRRLSAVGCGEFQPIADNATPEGRARNRRIALVVLPEQFVPTDVTGTNAPSAGAAASTNAPAAGNLATNALPVAMPGTNAPSAPATSDAATIPPGPVSAGSTTNESSTVPSGAVTHVVATPARTNATAAPVVPSTPGVESPLRAIEKVE